MVIEPITSLPIQDVITQEKNRVPRDLGILTFMHHKSLHLILLKSVRNALDGAYAVGSITNSDDTFKHLLKSRIPIQILELASD